MVEPTVAYQYEPVVLGLDALSDWTVTADDIAHGDCPKCGHSTDIEVRSSAIAQGIAPEATPPIGPDVGEVRLFECRCNRTHMQGSTAHLACGRWWLVRVMPEGVTPRVRPELSNDLLPAARALAAQETDAEPKIRAAAEKWVGGVTALLALFGLAGVVTGSTAVAGLSAGAKVLLAIVLVVAVACAIRAIVLSYRAAYGWPHTVDVDDSAKLLAWFKGQQSSADTVARRLRRAVWAAAISLLALVAGVGVVWFGTATPAPLVQVSVSDGSIVCGTLISSVAPATIRVRRPAGDVQVVAVTQVTMIEDVTVCSS